MENKHGGKRENAGRKKATSKSVLLQFKVPEEKAVSLKFKIRELIKQSKTKTINSN